MLIHRNFNETSNSMNCLSAMVSCCGPLLMVKSLIQVCMIYFLASIPGLCLQQNQISSVFCIYGIAHIRAHIYLL